jgi:SepF-like predicted cell division protein (DUF552 family)
MSFLKKLLGKEEPVELPAEEEPVQPVYVRIENLKDFVDIERITKLVKEGNIVFLKTKELQRTDLGEFQNCVQKLKRVSNQFGFDIAGTEEGYLVVTPSFAKIAR